MFEKEIIIGYFRKYPLEILLILIAFVITIYSFMFSQYQEKQTPEVLSETTVSSNNDEDQSYKTALKSFSIEVSGAILKPDVYEVAPGTRLKDVINISGGLSESADSAFVARNFNLARFVADQEKIYIPYTWDIRNGTFIEEKRILEYLQPVYGQDFANATATQNNSTAAIAISINSASLSELDTLPGIGPVTAQKIVDSRPYTTLDQLLERKVMSQSTFEELRELIRL